MFISKKSLKMDERSLQLADSVETASTLLRGKGREEDAISLFRLRIKIREGLPYELAKPIFEEHTKSILRKKL